MSTPHDWSVTVPDDVPMEIMIETRDGLRSGQIALNLGPLERHPMAEKWLREVTEQMIAAYEAKIKKRMS